MDLRTYDLNEDIFFPTHLSDKFLPVSSFSSPTGLNFASWMAFNIPGLLLNLLLGYLWLQLCFTRLWWVTGVPVAAAVLH